MDDAWYEDFFSGLALELWREACTPEQTREEVDFLERVLRLEPGSRLLDVPCGNGRHARELAARGHAVTGIDLSQEFLAEARQRAASAGVAVEWLEGDMRDLPPDGAFDGAYCLGNSFGYLDHAGNREFLLAVGQSLRRGGAFVLETGLAAESILPEAEGRRWMPVGDMLLLIENHYRVELSRLETEYTFVRDGRTETRSGSQQVYTVAEIGRLLSEADLVVESLYASPDERPYEFGSQRLFVVAIKR